MSTRIFKVEHNERTLWAGEISKLEAIARYPLGNDHFRIDHGADYFAFFDRLGDVAYYLAVENGEVVAVGCGMLRSLPFASATTLAWYIGDLKVRPDHRGKHLPLRMMATVFAPEAARCARGYGISMNPPTGVNRVATLFARFPTAPMRVATTLQLFSLNAVQMQQALPEVQHLRGPTTFLSLAGVKDIVLASTGVPLPLLHAQFGPLADRSHDKGVRPDSVHMFCAPTGDPLVQQLAGVGITPSASATVIALRMDSFDWRNILTSEI